MTAVPRRIWGLETEYGISCASTTGGRPPLDAEDAARVLFRPVVRLGRSTNVFLANGGRIYLDVGSHPEYATAECDQLSDLLAQDRAGVVMLHRLAARANERLSSQGIEGEIHLFRNNLDTAGNSFGCHENYLIRRRPDYKEFVAALVPYFVTRQIVVGAGHVRGVRGRLGFEFSQRAGQMWDAVSSATTRSRPIVNTRDEPHADVNLYRRMHVIVGDSNMAEGSTLVKVAVTDLLLALAEAGKRFHLELTDPMAAIRETSGDLTGQVELELTDGRRMSALAMQRYYLAMVLEAFGEEPSPWHAAAIDLWRRGLDAVETGDHSIVATELDWAIKERLVEQYLRREGASIPSLRRLLLAYHDITGSPLFGRMEDAGLARRLTSPDDVTAAGERAPVTTRAHLRGRFIAAAQERRRDFTVDWVHMKLADSAPGTLMLYDPFANSDERVDELIDSLGGS
ncbi:MAG TPA: Pup--protein ligase [Actinomycetaceae bacterium]|nr:Pup--protein ligase [Actinomycetaceae bacterium]